MLRISLYVYSYYKPRWDFFIDYIIQVVQNVSSFNFFFHKVFTLKLRVQVILIL